MNTSTLPAKVAPIGARHPKVSDNGDESDNRPAKWNLTMGLAAAMPFLGAFLGVCALALWAVFSKG